MAFERQKAFQAFIWRYQVMGWLYALRSSFWLQKMASWKWFSAILILTQGQLFLRLIFDSVANQELKASR